MRERMSIVEINNDESNESQRPKKPNASKTFFPFDEIVEESGSSGSSWSESEERKLSGLNERKHRIREAGEVEDIFSDEEIRRSVLA